MNNEYMLRREISYALRHAPWQYALELDGEGWVKVEHLLFALKENPMWKEVTEKDLIRAVEEDTGRIELSNGWIRGCLSHS